MASTPFRCPICRLPHDAGTTVCPLRGVPIAQPATNVRGIAPLAPSTAIPRPTAPNIPERAPVSPVESAERAPSGPSSERFAITAGTTLGPYIVEREIGAGAMGVVFAAVHSPTQRRVAVKTLARPFWDDPIATARFRKEARLAGSLGHVNVVEVFDVGVVPDGSPFLVMELLEGETLAKRLTRAPRLGIDACAGIVAQTLSALVATHDRGIIHRDLKSENVFLARHVNGAHVVKVLDFGISKAVRRAGDAGPNTVLTREGTVLGTPAYMSPEQAAAGEVDPRTDLYSVGVIAYEILAGSLPYVSRHPTYLLLEMKSRTPKKLRDVRPDVPEALVRIIERLMSLNRDERYASAPEALDALGRTELIPQWLVVG